MLAIVTWYILYILNYNNLHTGTQTQDMLEKLITRNRMGLWRENTQQRLEVKQKTNTQKKNTTQRESNTESKAPGDRYCINVGENN